MNKSENAQQAGTAQRKLPALLESRFPKHLCCSRENTVLSYCQIIHCETGASVLGHTNLMVHSGRRRVCEVYSYSMPTYLLLPGILPLLLVIILGGNGHNRMFKTYMGIFKNPVFVTKGPQCISVFPQEMVTSDILSAVYSPLESLALKAGLGACSRIS